MRTPHTHGGTDAPECTTCRETVPTLTREDRERWRVDAHAALGAPTYWSPGSVDDAVDDARRILTLLDALDAAEQERDSVQFALDGFRQVARKDNEYLLARAERAEAAQDRVLLRVEGWRSLYPMTVRFPERYATEIIDALLDIDGEE